MRIVRPLPVVCITCGGDLCAVCSRRFEKKRVLTRLVEQYRWKPIEGRGTFWFLREPPRARGLRADEVSIEKVHKVCGSGIL